MSKCTKNSPMLGQFIAASIHSVDKSEPALLYALVSAMVELYRGSAEQTTHLFGFAQKLAHRIWGDADQRCDCQR